MIWLQSSVCFLVWIAYGLAMRRRSAALKTRMQGLTPQKRVMFGAGGLILGLFVLAVGLFALDALGGTRDGALTLWAWPIVAVLGLLFIHLQVLGAAAMLASAVGSETAAASDTSNSQENDQT
ncbi:MAG: hypothetical protein IH944_13420 [Armatimonadetes bacterium]|nr:hypothetical protein [Armatimonadota bacterium]